MADSMSTTEPVTMEKIVALCKRRGFIFQSSEIYGGLASTTSWNRSALPRYSGGPVVGQRDHHIVR